MASWTCCETPDLIARQIDAVRMRTDEPFGVNLIPAATDPGLLKAEFSSAITISKIPVLVSDARYRWNRF